MAVDPDGGGGALRVIRGGGWGYYALLVRAAIRRSVPPGNRLDDLGCLLGHLRPSSGTITIDGLSPDAMGVKAQVGFLPERLLFDRWMSGTRS